jgi:hypothetical protein
VRGQRIRRQSLDTQSQEVAAQRRAKLELDLEGD